jgi:hypothetical protein
VVRYSLQCENDHAFEGWFASSADFDKQLSAGYVACPHCNSQTVAKLLMAPNVTTGRQKDGVKQMVMDNTRREMIAKMKEVVAEIRSNSEDVGEKFPEEARKIHYGETEARGIIGQASHDEAAALVEEGIQIAALPVLPEDAN